MRYEKEIMNYQIVNKKNWREQEDDDEKEELVGGGAVE
jgi:hypothetical protein